VAPIAPTNRHPSDPGVFLSDSLNAASREPSPLVIVSTTGTGGDIQPFIAMALGLHERGRRVVMLLPKFHEDAAKVAGVPYETFGTHEEFQAALSNPALWDERKGWGVIWNGAIPHLNVLHDMIQRLSTHEPCVVLSHPLLIPIAALARSIRPDLHIVAAYLAPSNLCSSYDLLTAGSQRIPPWIPFSWRQSLWRLIHQVWIDPTTLPSLNAARALHKLPRVPHFFEHLLKAPNASIGLFPEWYASVQADWPRPFLAGNFPSSPMRSAATAALSPELERFLSDGDSPIVFTPGTGHQHAASYFSTAQEALKRLRRRGLFITSHAAQVPHPLPPNILWQAHVPFAMLLPRVAAVVHHGGIGTTAEAFRAGVPQLVVPFAYDQFDNALRAKRMGVADVLLAKRLSARRMHRQLVQLLSSPKISRACSIVAEAMRQDSDMPWLLERVETALGLGLDQGLTKADFPDEL